MILLGPTYWFNAATATAFTQDGFTATLTTSKSGYSRSDGHRRSPNAVAPGPHDSNAECAASTRLVGFPPSPRPPDAPSPPPPPSTTFLRPPRTRSIASIPRCRRRVDADVSNESSTPSNTPTPSHSPSPRANRVTSPYANPTIAITVAHRIDARTHRRCRRRPRRVAAVA